METVETSPDKPLLDTDIKAPCLLIIRSEKNPGKRHLFYAVEKIGKGTLTEAFSVNGLFLDRIKESPDLLMDPPSCMEHKYLPNAEGGKDKTVNEYNLPTDEERALAVSILKEAEVKAKKLADEVHDKNYAAIEKMLKITSEE